MPDDFLRFDLSRDLVNIDAAATRIILDDEISREFRGDPNGTMIRVGMHPPTSPEVNERTNRVFYAVMTNKPLADFVADYFQSFSPPNIEHYVAIHDEGLHQGQIKNDLEYDLLAADHILRNADAMRHVFRLMLTDLNKKKILKAEYSEGEINSFLDKLIPAIIDRRPIREHPVLEEWDRNYGVGGFHFGAEAVEVGPVATIAVLVELAAGVTVMAQAVRSIQTLTPSNVEFFAASIKDQAAATRLMLISRMLQFGAELQLHAVRFEAR
jgi:hypothetical protein